MKIFLLSSERSGSNLLRKLIGNHSTIHAPIAPHFIATFNKLLPAYGSLEMKENRERLVKHALQLANHPYHNWQMQVSFADLDRDYDLRSLPRIVNALYSEKAKSNDKTGYFSKGINNYDYAHFIKGMLPDAKFIYLTRDPRDVCASWLKTPLFKHTAYQVAKEWVREQKSCMIARTVYADDTYTVRYEDIIEDTTKVMTGVLKFLNLLVESDCFSMEKKEVVKTEKNNELWKNLGKPVMRNNSKKYLKSLSPKQINLLETMAQREMEMLGYDDFSSPRNWEKGSTVLFNFKEILRINKSKKNRSEGTLKTLEGIASKKKLIASFKNS